ncbi:MAG: hypothetical protein AAF481_05295 [Acidobacteriota bacterium]
MNRAHAAAAILTCPQCGGKNAVESGERFVVCEYCDTTLFLDGSGLVLHYRLPRLVDEPSAGEALRRWMAGNETVKHLDRDAKIEEMTAVSFPMWFFRHRAGGAETTRVEPAAPTAIGDVAGLDVPVGQLETYTPEEGAEIVEAAVPLETARRWLPDDKLSELAETALVHIPLWRSRYRYRNQTYVALVEGSTGTVLTSVFPEKAESPYYLIAGLGLLLFGVEGVVLSNLVAKFAAYAVTAVPLTLVAFLIARKV